MLNGAATRYGSVIDVERKYMPYMPSMISSA